VAIIAANAQRAIPYFKTGVKGVARSMPTSAALDKVAAKLGLKCYEVPTGWKFFGNLMDAGSLSVCGEESFGTGSDHIREKDGVWAVLAWMSILRLHNPDESKPLVSVQEIVEQHWALFGRNYYCRYDYESVDSAQAAQLMAELVTMTTTAKGTKWGDFTVDHADEFTYTDPVDQSVSAHQGIRFLMTDGSRVIFRLSGTGSVGATIRMYVENYETDASKLKQPSAQALAPLIALAVEKCKMKEICGRDKPTVIT
jgi:phosphoglucomutase